jgi:hypothetical protein
MKLKKTMIHQIHRPQLFLAAACLIAGCRTAPAKVSASVLDLSGIPPAGDCQKKDQTISCSSFDQGKGSDTTQPIEDKGLQVTWIGDLAQLYEYYETQLGHEFEEGHEFKDLSFESEQILVVTDEQSVSSGRKIRITKIEKDGDGYAVYVDKWAPKKKGSGCKSFSRAISRPYHMVRLDKVLSFHGEERPEIKLVPTQNYYKCPSGQLLE